MNVGLMYTDMASMASDLVERLKTILNSKLCIAGHDAWEGHYYYVGGIEDAVKDIAELFCAQLAAAEADKYALNCSYDAAQERLKVTFERAEAAESRLKIAIEALTDYQSSHLYGARASEALAVINGADK